MMAAVRASTTNAFSWVAANPGGAQCTVTPRAARKLKAGPLAAPSRLWSKMTRTFTPRAASAARMASAWGSTSSYIVMSRVVVADSMRWYSGARPAPGSVTTVTPLTAAAGPRVDEDAQPATMIITRAPATKQNHDGKRGDGT